MAQAVNRGLQSRRRSTAIDGHINTALCELSQSVDQVTALLCGINHIRRTQLLHKLQPAVHDVDPDDLLDLQVDSRQESRNTDTSQAEDNDTRALRGPDSLQHRPGPSLKPTAQRSVAREDIRDGALDDAEVLDDGQPRERGLTEELAPDARVAVSQPRRRALVADPHGVEVDLGVRLAERRAVLEAGAAVLAGRV